MPLSSNDLNPEAVYRMLDNDKSIIDNFEEFNINIGKLRAYLGNFLFSGDEIYKKIKVLSPGERSRVALAKISISKPNLLILDEPTNHLDPETQKIIANTFKDYDGTLLLVSHNLEFVDNLNIDRMLLLPSGEIKYYDKEIVKYYQEINMQKNKTYSTEDEDSNKEQKGNKKKGKNKKEIKNTKEDNKYKNT